MESRTTDHDGLLYPALHWIGVSLLGLLLAGCSPGQSIAQVQTPAPIPASTATAVPTVAPTPTPAPIAGIDEPVVVKEISVKDTSGITRKGDLKLRILTAYTEEGRRSGDAAPIYPDNPSNIFFTLELELTCPANCERWVGNNATLTYDGKEYKVGSIGWRYNEGRLAASLAIFTVPRDSGFGQYVFHLPDGQTIKLATFFK